MPVAGPVETYSLLLVLLFEILVGAVLLVELLLPGAEEPEIEVVPEVLLPGVLEALVFPVVDVLPGVVEEVLLFVFSATPLLAVQTPFAAKV